MRRYNVPKARDSNKQVTIVKYRRRKKRTAKSIPALSGVNGVNVRDSGLLTEVNFGFSIWYEESQWLPQLPFRLSAASTFVYSISQPKETPAF